jgi:outer membrane protein assembly factor BamD
MPRIPEMIHPSTRTRSVLFASLLALAGAVACGGGGDTKVDYQVSAKQNYERGSDALANKSWAAAAKYFSFIKARFPYSKYAVLAELRLADAELGAENHAAAIDAYKAFLKFHPSHEMVVNGYVAYKIGAAYVAMLPEDFWISPPAYEKDQSATSDAFRELSAFIRKYPGSPYLPDAKKAVLRVNQRLAEHEMYVAKYYWKRGKAMGTVLRLRRLIDRHAGTRYDAEALYLLGKAYAKVNMKDRAKKTWERLVREHPGDFANDARGEMSAL